LHVRDLALPASIGLFFQTMYNVVDTYYAGQYSEVALAAVGLSFPVFLLVIGASSGLSRGSAGLISNAIGAKATRDQKPYDWRKPTLFRSFWGMSFSLLEV